MSPLAPTPRKRQCESVTETYPVPMKQSEPSPKRRSGLHKTAEASPKRRSRCRGARKASPKRKRWRPGSGKRHRTENPMFHRGETVTETAISPAEARRKCHRNEVDDRWGRTKRHRDGDLSTGARQKRHRSGDLQVARRESVTETYSSWPLRLCFEPLAGLSLVERVP